MPEPVVLLPGMMCDGRLFSHQFLALNRERAVMIAPLTGASTVGALAQQVLDQAPKRFALAGLSMGGIVAMEMMARAPDRISRFALMDTNPLAETPQVAAAREPHIVGAQSGRLEEIMREEMKPRYLAPGPGRVEVMNTVMEMARDLGPEIFVAQSRALQRRPDQQKVLRAVKVPTLVLCGVHDALCPVKRHEFMAELIPGAKLRLIEDAGHLPTLEQPERTTEALREWLGDPLVLR
ncbi:MAG: alpha/beta fold hydrolase [Pseudomonadota bacterium]